MLEKIFIFILFLGPLIFFHELGHYLFAKLFKVKVETFSIGFGPKLFKFKKWDTVFALSVIPLGGYVKMFGDDPTNKDAVPEEDRHKAFTHKGKWARFWIVFGGPLANFIFAYFLFASLFLVGEKVPETKFGLLEENSVFYQAGIRSGDLLTHLNNNEVVGLSDVAILDENEQINSVGVLRAGKKQVFSINLTQKEFIDTFIESPPALRRSIVANSNGEFFYLSFYPGKVNYDLSIEEGFSQGPHSSVYLYPAKYILFNDRKAGEKAKVPEIDLQKEIRLNVAYESEQEFYRVLQDQGYYTVDLMVQSIAMKTPADTAKMEGRDIIVSMNGVRLMSFNQLRKQTQKLPEDKPSTIVVLRKGERVNIELTPQVQIHDGVKAKKIGVYSSTEYVPLKFRESKSKGFFNSLYLAFGRTWDTTWKTLDGFKKLITGEVSMKTMGGPLAIGKVASDSLNISLSYFFKIMALISINLGIVNLFPVPVLDGGHILYIFLEIVNRGPLSVRKMEIAQQFGVSILLMLLVLALFNDFSRYFSGSF